MKHQLTFKDFVEQKLNESINTRKQFPSIKNTNAIDELRKKWLIEMEQFDKLFEEYDNLQ